MVDLTDLSPGDAVIFRSLKPEKYGPVRVGTVANSLIRRGTIRLEWEPESDGDSGFARVSAERIIAVIPTPDKAT